MVRLLHLWHYYQRPGFLLGGVPWSNIWYSGVLTTACYGALRLAARWAPATSPAVPVSRDQGWQNFAMGALRAAHFAAARRAEGKSGLFDMQDVLGLER